MKLTASLGALLKWRAMRKNRSHRAALGRLAGGFAAAALCLLLRAADAEAKGDFVPRWSVGAQAGAALPDTDEYGGSATWRVGLGYAFAPSLEVAVEWGRYSTAITQPDRNGIPTHTLASGVLDVSGFSATLRWRRELPELFASVYLGGGAGFYLLGYEMSEGAKAVYRRSGTVGLPNQAVENAAGLHAAGGVEYVLTPWVRLAGEVRYTVLEPKASGTTYPGMAIGGRIDLSSWSFTGGVRIGF